jgi:hypothetical protein
MCHNSEAHPGAGLLRVQVDGRLKVLAGIFVILEAAIKVTSMGQHRYAVAA